MRVRSTMRLLLSIVQGIHTQRRTVNIGCFAFAFSFAIFPNSFVDIAWKGVYVRSRVRDLFSIVQGSHIGRRTVSVGTFAVTMVTTIFVVSFVDIA